MPFSESDQRGHKKVELLAELLRGMKRQRKVQERVDRCVAAGQCLIEGCKRSNRESGGACGLCSMHYAQHTRKKMNRSLEEKMTIDIKAIRAGRLLERHEIPRQSKHDKAAS